MPIIFFMKIPFQAVLKFLLALLVNDLFDVYVDVWIK